MKSPWVRKKSLVEEMPEIFIRNDEGRIHKFSDLLEIWIFVPEWTFHTQAEFQDKNVIGFFANIMAKGPRKAKVQ